MTGDPQTSKPTEEPQRPLAKGSNHENGGSGSPPYPQAGGSLPYSKWWPFFAGALIGVALRLIYSGNPGQAYAAMTWPFFYLTPVVVGAVTVYVAETRKRREWAYYFWAPIVANVLFVIGTMLIMIEGLICAVIILPLFCLLGAVGGLIMGAVCRITRWPKQALYSLAVLPVLLGGWDTDTPIPLREVAVERTVTIDAKPATIWREILDARDIRAEEVRSAWLYRIGVPLPLAGVTEQTAEGLIRKVTMAKNIHFEQLLTEVDENRFLRWRYRFNKESFPPYALDEHVVLGGHYFDITSTAYTLTPRGQHTELKIRMQYRVSTQFNWYADPVARLLLGNLGEINLDYYRRRSEASQQHGK